MLDTVSAGSMESGSEGSKQLDHSAALWGDYEVSGVVSQGVEASGKVLSDLLLCE